MNYLPHKLVKLRKHYNYSQSYLAEILDIDVLEYMGYENGRAVISYEQCKKLASFYHVGIIDMFRNDDQVPLYEVAKAHTDELNIEYFIPRKTPIQKFFSLIRRHKIMTGLVCGAFVLLLVISIVLLKKNNDPYTAVLLEKNRLAVSDTSVVYIDNNAAVKGSGDNSNSQLSNLPSSNAIKVAEGGTFTLVLKNDGTVEAYGLTTKLTQTISEWKNIVDVVAGNGHILAVDDDGEVFVCGDNSYGQCEVNDWRNIVSLYAGKYCSFGIDDSGNVYYCGEFIGSSKIKSFDNPLDIAVSDNNLVVLKNDGTVSYYSKNKDYLSVNTWNDIIDVCCGNDFIAGLDKNGKVSIAIDNVTISDEVCKWENIIAIAAGDDYLIGFDGIKIYGVGRNAYRQFEPSIVSKQTLPQVSDVKIELNKDSVDVQFEPVDNAKEYLVSLAAGIGQSFRVQDHEVVSFDNSELADGMSYDLTIISLGDEDYEDSLPLVMSFKYHVQKDEQSPKDSVSSVEVPFTIDVLLGKTKTNFEAYLMGLGVSDLEGIESENPCQGQEAVIESVEGLSEYEKITRSELLERHITYTYCKIEENE